MSQTKDTNPDNYVSHEDAEGVDDRGDDLDPTLIDAVVTKKTVKKTVVKKQPAAAEEEEEEGEEEEEEGEEEEEEGEEEEDDDDKKPDDTKGKRVPYGRFARQKEARVRAEARAQAAEAMLQELEESRTTAQRTKLKETTDKLELLYDQVEEARATGKTKDAAKLQREIDEIRDGMTRTQAAHFASKVALEESNVRVFNTLVKELEAIDPRFDKKHDDHDPELVEEMAELIEAYEAKGMNAPDALRKATKTILREDPFSSAKKTIKKLEPRKTDVAKNLKTAKKQPAEEPNNVRERGSKIDIAGLSEKDFDALPEAVRRRERGDEI